MILFSIVTWHEPLFPPCPWILNDSNHILSLIYRTNCHNTIPHLSHFPINTQPHSIIQHGYIWMYSYSISYLIIHSVISHTNFLAIRIAISRNSPIVPTTFLFIDNRHNIYFAYSKNSVSFIVLINTITTNSIVVISFNRFTTQINCCTSWICLKIDIYIAFFCSFSHSFCVALFSFIISLLCLAI